MKSRLPERNRIVWILIALLLLTNFVILVYVALRQPGIIVQQFKGEKGNSGQSVQGPKGNPGYTPVKGVDYFDGRDGRDGQSIVGPQGPQGVQGPAGQNGTNGTNGTDGQDGKTPEFECLDGDFVTRYQGDDAWRVLEKNSVACKGHQ